MAADGEPKIYRINGVGLDVVVSETIDLQSDVTAYPVEDGEDVSDHVHNQPLVVVVEAIVSGTPIALANEREDNPVAQVRAALEEIRSRRQPFTYEGVHRIYKSMVFEALSFPRDPSTGNTLRISATMRQVNLRELVRVASAFRPAPKSSGPPLWLCPSKQDGLFLGLAGARLEDTKPGKDAALNRRAGCRRVVKRGGFYVFADNGKKLNESELDRLSVQNDVIANPVKGSAIVSKPPPGTPVIPVMFAPGSKAVQQMSKPPTDPTKQLKLGKPASTGFFTDEPSGRELADFLRNS
jgi:hypothetical protein